MWHTAKKQEYPSQSGRPLLDNGYASRSGFIGNAYKSTQQPTSEYWKYIGGSFPRQRVLMDKFPAQQIGRFMTTYYLTCFLVSPRRAYFTGSNVDRIWDSKIWQRVLRESDPKITALARTSCNCKRQTRPLVREGAPNKKTRNCHTIIKIWT
jgi:hypothetical protein